MSGFIIEHVVLILWMNVIGLNPVPTFELQIREEVLHDLSLRKLSVKVSIEFLKLTSNLSRGLILTHWVNHELKGVRVVSDHLLLGLASRGWSGDVRHA